MDEGKALEDWQEQSQPWLDHWANLSAAFPSSKDAYITSLKSNPDRSMSFTVKARSSAVITDLAKRLSKAGYQVKLGSESTADDELGYRHSTSVRVTFESSIAIEVKELKPVPRPADDGSADMIRRGTSSRSRSSSSQYTRPVTTSPTASKPDTSQSSQAKATSASPLKSTASNAASSKSSSKTSSKTSSNFKRSCCNSSLGAINRVRNCSTFIQTTSISATRSTLFPEGQITSFMPRQYAIKLIRIKKPL